MEYKESDLLLDLIRVREGYKWNEIVKKCRASGLSFESLQIESKQKVVETLKYIQKLHLQGEERNPNIIYEVPRKKKPEK